MNRNLIPCKTSTFYSWTVKQSIGKVLRIRCTVGQMNSEGNKKAGSETVFIKRFYSLSAQGDNEGRREDEGVEPGVGDHLPPVPPEDAGPEDHLQVRTPIFRIDKGLDGFGADGDMTLRQLALVSQFLQMKII